MTSLTDDIVFDTPEVRTEVVLVNKTTKEVITMRDMVRDLIAGATATGDPLSARFPGNWPASATHAVEYSYHDRQFPSVHQERYIRFFDTEDAYDAWKVEQCEFVRGTDYDFSVSVSWFRWDLGPEFLGSFTI